jgi:OOP family OmpA-OmpF porin
MRVPIAPNTNKDGSDNPGGRQLNRRTEIKVVGEISSSDNTE